jgi:hypothetical protein
MLEIREGQVLTLADWRPQEFVKVFKLDGDIFKGRYCNAAQLDEFVATLDWKLYETPRCEICD